MTTRAPSRARVWAMAAPMPRLAPVTSANLPWSLMTAVVSAFLGGRVGLLEVVRFLEESVDHVLFDDVGVGAAGDLDPDVLILGGADDDRSGLLVLGAHHDFRGLLAERLRVAER